MRYLSNSEPQEDRAICAKIFAIQVWCGDMNSALVLAFVFEFGGSLMQNAIIVFEIARLLAMKRHIRRLNFRAVQQLRK